MLLKDRTLEKYNYTIESLTHGSSKKVCLQCDYCQNEYESTYKQYNNAHDVINKDACIKCKYVKRRDISMALYGVENSAQRPEVRQKISENCEGFDDKRRAIIKAKYGVENPMENAELKERQKQSVINKYGVENVSQIKEVREKVEATNLKKYGNKQFLGSEVGREKKREGMLNKYGVENAFEAEEVKQKIRATNMQNLGVEMPTQSPEVMAKIEQTNMERYGCKTPAQNDEVKQKIAETNLERYGYKSPQQSPEIKQKIKEKAIETGRWNTYDGKSFTDLAKEFEIPYTTLIYHTKLYGIETALKMTPQISALEKIVQLWLDEEQIKYKLHFTVDGRKSDFLLTDKNIILEIDGLYWHCEINRPDDYHIIKRDVYVNNGYTPLFFREDEIKNKFDIVKSIIMNKLCRSNRIFARKCDIIEMDNKESNTFLGQNHLMGAGAGQTYALAHGGEVVSAIRVKCTNKHERAYEVSRFCHKLNTQVIGGFSRLIKNFLYHTSAKTLTTFIDRRYGSGAYLTDLGFTHTSCHPSFSWTNATECVHRMRFRGNSGYDSGFVKLWDCGQARYDLSIK
jgi:very-short-patch-repair endonuclease